MARLALSPGAKTNLNLVLEAPDVLPVVATRPGSIAERRAPHRSPAVTDFIVANDGSKSFRRALVANIVF